MSGNEIFTTKVDGCSLHREYHWKELDTWLCAPMTRWALCMHVNVKVVARRHLEFGIFDLS